MYPYVIVNVAMSADGKLSTHERRQVRISGKDDFLRVDRLKSECDGVMIGIGTVLADDPSLTVKSADLIQERRKKGLSDNPVRIIIDSLGRIPLSASILHKGQGKRIIAVSDAAGPHTVAGLSEFAKVIRSGSTKVDLKVVMKNLKTLGIHRCMVEGGGTLISSLFMDGLVNELRCYIGAMIIGGSDAPTLADGPGFIDDIAFPRLSVRSVEQVDDGVLISWVVKQNPCLCS